MGNYLANSFNFYKDNGCVFENNNTSIMTAVALSSPRKTDVLKESETLTKTSKFFSVVQLSAVVTMEKLQNEGKERKFFLSKPVCSKLRTLSYFPKVALTANENSEEIAKETFTVSQVTIDRDCTRIGISSFGSFNQNFQNNSKTATSDSILNSNTYRCCSNSRQQVGPNNFFLTSLINMVEILPFGSIQEPLNTAQEAGITCNVSPVELRAGVSFFVDLNEPYKQYPLNENYKFALYDDRHSSSGDSFCSIQYCSDEASLCDEDFIVFEEQFDEEDDDFYEFHVTLNDCVRKDSLNYLEGSSGVSRCSIDSKSVVENIKCSNLVSRKCKQADTDETNNIKQENISHETSRKVHFQADVELAIIHHMKQWDFAYREARKGPWELAAADRCRFSRRIKESDLVISPCLQRKLQSIKKL